ncbi:MAG: metal-dependent transcriptional regulator [Promethearchaeota archaeon]
MKINIDNVPLNNIEYDILTIFLTSKTGIRPGSLKKALNMKHSTINSALKRMEEKELLIWHHYGEVKLLPKGINLLQHIQTHHQLVEVYLIDTLSLDSKKAHEESLRISPHFSCEVIKKICDKYRKDMKYVHELDYFKHHERCHPHAHL